MRWGRSTKTALVVSAALFAVIQLVPFGRDHVNPPVQSQPEWSSPRVRELAVGACFDCHSNETQWPWYAHVAPFSWLVQRDVDGGRDELNWSEWERGEEDGDDIVETILDGEMPPLRYELAHPDARLTEAEMQTLTEGILDTFPDD